MSATLDPDQLDQATRSQRPWFQPVFYAFLAALVVLCSGICCWSPMINIILPVPPCMGGYDSRYAQDVRALVFFDQIGLGIVFPFALILGGLAGLIVYLIFRNRRTAQFVKRSAVLAGILIGLGFGIAVPVIISLTMCNL